MKVTIVRFRSYVEKRTFTIPNFEIALISGISGSGKTTLLEAIAWCLYGSMQHIYPNESSPSSSLQTSVVIELPEAGGITISRCRPPDVLTVGLPCGKALVGDAATAYIVSSFGSKALWYGSSYISQGVRSPLVTLSNSEKFDLLRELTFGGEDQKETETPDYYIQRVEAQIDTVKQHLAVENAKYNCSMQVYEQGVKSNHQCIDLWGLRARSQEVVDSLSNAYILEAGRLHDAKQAYQSARDIETTIRTIEAEIASMDQRLQVLIDTTPDIKPLLLEFDRLTALCSKYSHQVTISDNLELLNKRRRVLPYMVIHDNVDTDALQRSLLEMRSVYVKLAQLMVPPAALQDTIARYIKVINDETSKSTAYTAWAYETKCNMDAYSAQAKCYDVEYAAKQEHAKAKHYAAVQLQNEVIRSNKDILQEYEGNVLLRKTMISLGKMREDLVADYAQNEVKFKNTQDKLAAHQVLVDADTIVWNGISTQPLTSSAVRDKIHTQQMVLAEESCPHCQMGVTFKEGKLHRGHATPDARTHASSLILVLEGIAHNLHELATLHTNLVYDESNLCKQVIAGPIVVPPEPALPVYQAVPICEMHKVPYDPPCRLVMAPQPVNGSDMTVTNCILRDLQSITVPPMPYVDVEAHLKSIGCKSMFHELSAQITALEQTVVASDVDIGYLNLSLAVVESQANEVRGKVQLITLLQSQVMRVVPEAPAVSSDVLAVQIAALTRDVVALQATISAGQIVIILDAQKSFLHEHHVKIMYYASYEASLLRLKVMIAEVATSAMDSVVNSINETANAILRDLFDEGIRVQLATHKVLKTKDKTKLQVNLQIRHKGTEYDSPSHLSGGEQDRISLALTLALAKANGTPFILLDECMASLNAELREKSLKVLRHHFTNKTILHICHEIVNGNHDSTIEV